MEVNLATGLEHCEYPIKQESCGIQDTCRICMAYKIKMNDLFSTENTNIVQKIEYCTGLQMQLEDGFPTHICCNCLHNLDIAHKFKSSCLQADATFRKVVLDIKTELNDDSFETDLPDDLLQPDVIEDTEQVTERTHRSTRLKKVTVKTNESQKATKKMAKKKEPQKKGPSRLKKLKFRRLFCEACQVHFDNKQQSDEHMKAHKQEPWICEICGKTYAVRSSHHAHVKSHMGPTHRCDHCEYSAVYKGDLIKHLRRHFGKKRYQCHFCPAEYYESSNLYSHVRRVHDGIKRYQCDHCEQRFYERTKLRRHMDTHSDVKRFECELCLSRFSRRCQWRHHLERRHAVIVPRQRPGPKKIDC